MGDLGGRYRDEDELETVGKFLVVEHGGDSPMEDEGDEKESEVNKELHVIHRGLESR